MNRTTDIIAVGSVTQDTYLISSKLSVKKSSGFPVFSFPLGTKMELQDVLIEVGGGATNAAATFAHFGLRTAVFVECGDDPSGEFAIAELKKRRIDTSHIRVEKGGRTAYSVFFLAANGERTVFVYRGASAGLQLNIQRIAGLDPKWIYVTSLGGDLHSLQQITSFSKKQGSSVAWNPGKTELAFGKKKLKPFLNSSAVVLLNSEEAQGLFGKVSTEKELMKKIRSITSTVVVVTQDRKGSHAFVGNTIYTAHIKPVQARDTTGAGDAFGSGFIAQLIKTSGRFDMALYAGSANAMSTVRQVGAKHGLIVPRHLNQFKNRIHITKKTYAHI